MIASAEISIITGKSAVIRRAEKPLPSSTTPRCSRSAGKASSTATASPATAASVASLITDSRPMA